MLSVLVCHCRFLIECINNRVTISIIIGIAGYVSGAFYRQLGGTDWVLNVGVTFGLFTGPTFLVWAYLNTVALFYGSSAALPFSKNY